MAEVTFKPAKVMIEGGEYTLTVGRTKKLIPIGEMNDRASVRKLAGKEDVVAAMSGRVIVAVGRRTAPCYWILCYYPVPDLYKKVLPDLRNHLIQKFMDERIIDKKFGTELKTQF